MALGVGEVVARVRAIVEVDTTQLSKGLSKASAEIDKASAKNKVLKASAAVAAGSIGILATGLYESAKAAVEAQGNTDRLNQSIKNAHLNMKTTTATLNTFAAAQSKYGVSANDAKGYLAQFITATGSANKSMRDMALAEDIAAAKHIDLASAVGMVTKAQAGSTRMMTASGLIFKPFTGYVDALAAKYKKLGLTTSNMLPGEQKQYNLSKAHAVVLDKERNATDLLRIGFQKYGGDASKASQTLEGKWATLHAQAQNLEVTVGTKLLPAITSVTNWMMKHSNDVKYMGVALAAVATASTAIWTATKVLNAVDGLKMLATRISGMGTAAAVATPEVEAMDAATGEAGLAGSLAVLGPVAIAAGVGLAAYYHSTKPNVTVSKSYSDAVQSVSAALTAGHQPISTYTQLVDKSTKTQGQMQSALEKGLKTGIDTNELQGKLASTTSNYIATMSKAEKETGRLASANAKTNPTLADGYQKASDYAAAAAELARNLGRIPSRTQISLVATMIEQGFSSAGKAGSSAHANHARGAYIGGAGTGDIVPAMLEPGEGVINRNAVRALGGAAAINAINGAVPRFASGGLVPPGRHPKEKAGAYRSRVSSWLSNTVDNRFNLMDFQLQLADRIAQRDDSEGNYTGEISQLLKEQKIRGQEMGLYAAGRRTARRFGLGSLATQYNQAGQMIHQDMLDATQTIKGLRGQSSGASAPLTAADLASQIASFLSDFSAIQQQFGAGGSAGAAAAAGVTINQHFNSADKPQAVALRQAQFAAQAVFGG